MYIVGKVLHLGAVFRRPKSLVGFITSLLGDLGQGSSHPGPQFTSMWNENMRSDDIKSLPFWKSDSGSS